MRTEPIELGDTVFWPGLTTKPAGVRQIIRTGEVDKLLDRNTVRVILADGTKMRKKACGLSKTYPAAAARLATIQSTL